MMVRDFVLAFQFLTRLPMPKIADGGGSDLGRASVFFPLVGLVIGALLALLMWLLHASGAWLAALAIVVGWVWITGALHLDGLGDVTDAFGASHGDAARFHEVLKDPHAGNFAVVAIALQLMAKLVLVAHLAFAVAVPALVLIPAWARWGTLVWRLQVPALRSGLGQDFSRGGSVMAPLIWAAGLAALSFFFAPMLLAALLVVPAVGFYWRWRLGGMTGDCLGASVEVTETLLLASMVLG